MQLGDVSDIEALALDALYRGLPASRVLSTQEHEDAITFLIGKAVELERRYDPAKDRSDERGYAPNLADFLSHRLRRLVVDWQRAQRVGGQAYRRGNPAPDFISIDASDNGEDGEGWRIDPPDEDEPTERERRLARLDARHSELSETVRTDAFIGFLTERDRRRVEAAEALGHAGNGAGQEGDRIAVEEEWRAA